MLYFLCSFLTTVIGAVLALLYLALLGHFEGGRFITYFFAMSAIFSALFFIPLSIAASIAPKWLNFFLTALSLILCANLLALISANDMTLTSRSYGIDMFVDGDITWAGILKQSVSGLIFSILHATVWWAVFKTADRTSCRTTPHAALY